MNRPTPQKIFERKRLAEDVEVFKAKGGIVTQHCTTEYKRESNLQSVTEATSKMTYKSSMINHRQSPAPKLLRKTDKDSFGIYINNFRNN